MSKAKGMFPSDTIAFKDVETGGNSAGNGGDGVNTGNISSSPSISFSPYNKAEGADVYVKTGDQVHQKADWDAGGANARRSCFRRQRAERPCRMATTNRRAAIINPTWMPAFDVRHGATLALKPHSQAPVHKPSISMKHG